MFIKILYFMFLSIKKGCFQSYQMCFLIFFLKNRKLFLKTVVKHVLDFSKLLKFYEIFDFFFQKRFLF